MNTYQRQLLDKLITELTDNASPNLHAAQMLAAELKGALGITPMMTLDTETGNVTPTTNAALICAAPDLLEALETLNLVIGLTPIAGNKDALQEACDIARAAIAKAKQLTNNNNQ